MRSLPFEPEHLNGSQIENVFISFYTLYLFWTCFSSRLAESVKIQKERKILLLTSQNSLFKKGRKRRILNSYSSL